MFLRKGEDFRDNIFHWYTHLAIISSRRLTLPTPTIRANTRLQIRPTRWEGDVAQGKTICMLGHF